MEVFGSRHTVCERSLSVTQQPISVHVYTGDLHKRWLEERNVSGLGAVLIKTESYLVCQMPVMTENMLADYSLQRSTYITQQCNVGNYVVRILIDT